MWTINMPVRCLSTRQMLGDFYAPRNITCPLLPTKLTSRCGSPSLAEYHNQSDDLPCEGSHKGPERLLRWYKDMVSRFDVVDKQSRLYS